MTSIFHYLPFISDKHIPMITSRNEVSPIKTMEVDFDDFTQDCLVFENGTYYMLNQFKRCMSESKLERNSQKPANRAYDL